MLEIKDYIPAKELTRAGDLYLEAFGAKLLPLLGPPGRLRRLLLGGLRRQRAVGAYDETGRLVALLGYHWEGESFTDITFSGLQHEFGLWGASWRIILMGILLDRKPDHDKQLLMDGISVAPEMRGRGVGTQMFAHLETLALKLGATEIKLDVIDSNFGARKLYLRLGFDEKGHTRVPAFLQKWLPVNGSTTMIKKLKG